LSFPPPSPSPFPFPVPGKSMEQGRVEKATGTRDPTPFLWLCPFPFPSYLPLSRFDFPEAKPTLYVSTTGLYVISYLSSLSFFLDPGLLLDVRWDLSAFTRRRPSSAFSIILLPPSSSSSPPPLSEIGLIHKVFLMLTERTRVFSCSL